MRQIDMKKLRICSSHIPIDIFDKEVVILVTNSLEYLHDNVEDVLINDLGMGDNYAKKFAEELKDALKEEEYLSPGLTVSITLKDGCSDVFCIFEGYSPKDVKKEVVIHEMYHATSAVCRKLGIEDEETSAYMIEYLCQKFFEIANDFGKKPKKG